MSMKLYQRVCSTGFFLITFTIVGCGGGNDQFKPITKVVDEANYFLSKEEASIKSAIDTLGIKKKVHIVVRTIDKKFAREKLSASLDSLYKNEPTWSTLPEPSGFQKVLRFLRIPNPTNIDKTVQIFILKNPPFIGIRFGVNARWRAFISRVLVGSEFLAIQNEATKGNIKMALNQYLKLFETSFPIDDDLSWYEKLAYNAFFHEIGEIIDEITLNSWEFYNRYLLVPVLKIQLTLRKFVHWSIGASILFVIVSILVIQIFLNLVGKVFPEKMRVVYDILIALPAEFGLALPTIGSLMILSNGRLEDRLFVYNLLGIQNNVDIFLPPSFFSVQTGILLSLFLAIFMFFYFASDYLWLIPLADLEPEDQQDMFEDFVEKYGYVSSALLFLGIYDIDAPDFDKKEPFSSVAGHVAMKSLKTYFRWLVILAISPLAVALYLSIRALMKSLIGFRSNLRAYGNTKLAISNL